MIGLAGDRSLPITAWLFVVMIGLAGDLMICRLSRSYGSVRGGDELFLLCSSVRKGTVYSLEHRHFAHQPN